MRTIFITALVAEHLRDLEHRQTLTVSFSRGLLCHVQ